MTIVLLLGVVLVIACALLVPVRLRLGFALLGGIASVIFVPAGALGSGVFASADGMILAAAWMALLTLSALRPVRWLSLFWLYVGVVLIGVFSAVIGGLGSQFAVIVALAGLMFVFIAGSLNEAEWRIVVRGVVLIACIQAFFCLFEAFIINKTLFVPDAYGDNPLFAGAIRGQGTLGHPLVAGFVMVVGIAFAFSLRVSLPIKLTLMAFLGAGAVATGSSSAIIATAFLVLAGFIASGDNRSRFLRSFLGVIVVLGAAALSVVPSALTADVSGQNSDHRANSILAIPRLFVDRSPVEAIFGSGWGSATELYQKGVLINDSFYAVDNQFTTIIAVSGLIGILLFLTFVLGLLVLSKGVTRIGVLTMLLMFVSFDVLNWASASALFITYAAFALAPAARAGTEKDDSVGVGPGVIALDDLEVRATTFSAKTDVTGIVKSSSDSRAVQRYLKK